MRIRRRCRNDDGVALVEMALVAPLLALLVAGIVEFGTLWRDNLTVATSTRAAARVVSNLGDSRLADYEALLTLDAALGGVDGLTVEGVLIYNAAAADGEPHSSCFDVAGDPQAVGARRVQLLHGGSGRIDGVAELCGDVCRVPGQPDVCRRTHLLLLSAGRSRDRPEPRQHECRDLGPDVTRVLHRDVPR